MSSHEGDGRIRRLAFLLTLQAFIASPAVASAPAPSTRAYGHQLVLARWHSEQEWRAMDSIIRPESGWNPCSSYPGRHDCSYAGSNSCGVPQANPCPRAWRGRLWQTRYAQVRWARDYVARRYGSPSGALAFRRAHGYY